MSLEVDGRQNNAPIPYQREEEGLIYLNGPGNRWHHGQNLHVQQIHETQRSPPGLLDLPFSGLSCFVLSLCWLLWQQVSQAPWLQGEGRISIHGLFPFGGVCKRRRC